MAGLMSYITPASIVSNIRMHRTREPKKSFLLVEGESDTGFYKNLIDKKKCRILSLSGKEKVEAAMRILNSQNVEGVIAVIDRDYDELLGQCEEQERLYQTDTHDVETMILKTGAFERFINEFGDDDRIERFQQQKGKTVLEEILNMANWVGMYRFLNMKCKWGVAFRRLDLSHYMSDKMELKTLEIVDSTLYNEEKKALRQGILRALENELEKGHDPWKISRGHDMTKLIAIVFSHRNPMSVGNTRTNGLSEKDVESSIRLAYREEDFHKTKLYENIKQWQDSNPTWIVLKNKELE